ncbi:protein ATAF2-like [Primulina huaijiensis]|uniref:protein ATAF2-like n=1 Tax=Primulina huaijiensis TaxID=1492673 RepID=UPI003CC76443
MEVDKDLVTPRGPDEEGRTSLIPQQLEDLPLGFRFNPTDQDLINQYLKKKLNNEPIPFDICTVNLYKYDPQELTGYYPKLGENEWYFFTQRDRKYPNGNRPNRAAGNGYWRATAADKPIYDNNFCIGFKRTLVFYQGKSPEGKKTTWIMHEYVVDKPSTQHMITSPEDMLLDKCVLCRIYNRSHGIRENNMIPEQCNPLVLPAQQNEQNLPIQQQNLPAQQAENDHHGGWLNYCNESSGEVFGEIESVLGSFTASISDAMVDLGPIPSFYDFDQLGDNNFLYPEIYNSSPGLPSLPDNVDHLQESFVPGRN